MAKTYKITLTEEQARVTQKCLEFYMRLMMGQTYDFVEELAFYNYDKRIEHLDEEQQKKVFDSCIQKRDAIEEVLRAIFRIVFDTPYNVPEEKTDDGMIAECLWDTICFYRGQSRWDAPFQIGKEPVPNVEVTDDETVN